MDDHYFSRRKICTAHGNCRWLRTFHFSTPYRTVDGSSYSYGGWSLRRMIPDGVGIKTITTSPTVDFIAKRQSGLQIFRSQFQTGCNHLLKDGTKLSIHSHCFGWHPGMILAIVKLRWWGSSLRKILSNAHRPVWSFRSRLRSDR